MGEKKKKKTELLLRIRNLRIDFVCSKCALKKILLLFSKYLCNLLLLLLLFAVHISSFFFFILVSFFFVFFFCTTSLVFFFFCFPLFYFSSSVALKNCFLSLDEGRRRNDSNSSITKTIVCLLFLSSSTKIIQFFCSLSLLFFPPSSPGVWGGERFPMLKAFLKLWNSFVVVVLVEESSCRIETLSLRERERDFWFLHIWCNPFVVEIL